MRGGIKSSRLVAFLDRPKFHSVMTDVMRKRRSLESFRFGRRDEEVAIDDVPLPENERRYSLRSFGGSMRSMFGREKSANPLSEFQQQRVYLCSSRSICGQTSKLILQITKYKLQQE